VAITDESMGVSQLLGARARAAPPKSMPMASGHRYEVLATLSLKREDGWQLSSPFDLPTIGAWSMYSFYS